MVWNNDSTNRFLDRKKSQALWLTLLFSKILTVFGPVSVPLINTCDKSYPKITALPALQSGSHIKGFSIRQHPMSDMLAKRMSGDK